MRKVSGRVRVALDFRTPEAALAFVDWLKAADSRYEDADAFAMDGLDRTGRANGITDGSTYLVKNARDRAPGSELRTLWDQKHFFEPGTLGPDQCGWADCDLPARSPVHRSQLARLNS